jgi:hypothetical protein
LSLLKQFPYINNDEVIIDLGMHPYADSFIKEKDLGKNEPVYPLVVEMDAHTGYIGTKYKTDPYERYADYTYTSSNSKYARDHWDEFARCVPAPSDSTVIEIGSNDGYLVAKYLPNTVIGVDASHEMGTLALEHGVLPITGLFNRKLAETLVKEFKNIGLIISNNVLNHTNELFDFIGGIEILMKNPGFKSNNARWVFEVPYWKWQIDNEKIDQIYHEHVSYFTVKYLKYALKYAGGLTINNVKEIEYHGGSLRVIASLDPTEDPAVEYMISQEKYLFNLGTYDNLMRKINKKKYLTLRMLYKLKLDGQKIVGLGAAAKGNTWLNFHKVDSSIIEFITDASPLKQGRYTPLSRIPIYDDEKLRGREYIYVQMLSWNISNSIKEKLRQINPFLVFIE